MVYDKYIVCVDAIYNVPCGGECRVTQQDNVGLVKKNLSLVLGSNSCPSSRVIIISAEKKRANADAKCQMLCES